MKILLLGNLGQLGWELQRTLAPLGNLVALDFPEIDLTKDDTIRRVIFEVQPTVVINATAYTAVDRAESEPDKAFAVNGAAPAILAETARECGALLIHYSTDYIYDGMKGSPYIESDIPNPLCVYGASKLAGENAIQQIGGSYLILRTSWVYSLRRPSFVTKVLEWSRKQESLRLVTDQIANPTWARMLAEWTALLLAKAAPEVSVWLADRIGVYHLAGSGYASRYEWGQAILENDPKKEEQTARSLLPALTEQFPSPATRPLFSALDCSKAERIFGFSLPDWRIALNLALSELTPPS